MHPKSIILALLVTITLTKHQMPNAVYNGFGADADFSVRGTVSAASLDMMLAAVQSYRRILFEPVLSPFVLSKDITISGITNLIIQGPIDFTMYGIRLINCSNIIINNIRIFNSSVNGILIYNSTNIVVDHVTILDAGRTNVDEGKSIDIREQSCNVTVSHSLLGFTSAVELMIKHRSILIANYSFGPVTNVSLHHNLFYCDYQSSPEISSTGLFDMVNNVIFNYTQSGSRIRNGAYGNFESNTYIGGKKNPLVFEGNPQVFAAYNVWRYDCTTWQYVNDTVTHDHYTVPPVYPDKFADITKVVQGSGCSFPTNLESQVKQNVLKQAM